MNRTLQYGKLKWIDIQDPSLNALSKLKEEHGFHDLDIEDCISETQRSKIDEYEDYLFIILHIPYYDSRTQKVRNEEVDIFIKNNLLVTVHWGVLKPLLNLYDQAESSEKSRKTFMGHGSGFLLYEIIDQLFSSCFSILDTLEKNLNSLEKEVFELSTEHDMLKDILLIKKNVIAFRRIISPQRAVIPQLEHKNKKFMPESLEIYFDDVVDKVEKIWGSLENIRELVESLHQTNETIISHTTNNVIKVLTVFSVLMLPLNFFAGLYGMNVALPGAENEQFFFIIAGTMLGIAFLMLSYFKYRRWI